MKPYYEQAGITIYHGDCLDILPDLDPVDCIITDPVWPNAPTGIYAGTDDYEPKRYFQAALVVFNERENPVLVPIEKP